MLGDEITYKKVHTHKLLITLIIAGLILLPTGMASATPPTEASGIISVTQITGLSIQPAGGGNFIIEQTTSGAVTGTLAGTFVDELRAILHPNGFVNAQGTITCTCTVAGKSGTIVFNQMSKGPLGSFEGTAVIVSGTGDLANLHGTLEIQGTVDPNGLATIAYSGQIHFDP